MRVFLITLAASVLASVIFWNFGLAAKIWPAHPLWATTILATVAAIIVQFLAQEDAATKKAK